MDPNNRGPEAHGHDGAGHGPRQRPPRETLTPEFAQHAPALARTVRVVAGEHLLTVNPVDGSEIAICPPGERPGRPQKYGAAERADIDRAARPPVPPGPPQPALPLLQRQDEREHLVRLLARGRSVRLTGPAGSGRTRLLDVVAEDCADLAPDGVVRLSGFHRTADELLHDLFHAVHHARLHRPERDELLACVRDIGVVVLLDDIEFGGEGLDALLEATPECAFLMSATPDVPAPSAESGVEEVALTGLERAAGLDLLERVVGRELTEDESNWAGDLWFESEGLPLRFVQAGALLRQRDRLRAGSSAVDEYGVFEDSPPDDMHVWPGTGDEILLPSLGEAAAPAPLLASRLSGSARAALRFAVALGGEVPHPAHLPALVGDTHADAALGELTACGLVSPVGSRYRLAAGVQAQLEAAGFADDVEHRAAAVAQHYAWWAGHPSVTPERVCVEADAILAALAVLAPLTTASGAASGEDDDGDEGHIAVQLARTSAPAFAAGLHWAAWERALRSGAEAARLAGDVAEQAYFHHELGIHALCGGQYDRARAELEASIGLRGALSDKRGTVAGRRALALVADRSGSPGLALTAGEGAPDAPHDESESPACGVPTAFPPLKPPAGVVPTAVARNASRGAAASRRTRGGIRAYARRNVVAGGAGALLVAVLGTVVTLGATSGNDGENPSDNVGVNPSASQGIGDGNLADTPENAGDAEDTGKATSRPTEPGPDGTLGTSDDPTPSASSSDEPSDRPSGTRSPSKTDTPSKSPTSRPTKSPTPTRSSTPSPTPTKPTETPTESPTPTESETSTSPSTTDSASASSSSSAGASESSSPPPLI
ncbi:ATP-binding protein [Streptomyces sp. DH24]|uniref:ATP-binding protein n=1 Tax=Streptomyces sp. DH24 TaxID=3040123 RepID=UPI0024421933|nr:ATP-binding protein [Streptomyces sp. DH24]MDG9716488.1 ATP-binding protein [Streptomyces sp. DH24]